MRRASALPGLYITLVLRACDSTRSAPSDLPRWRPRWRVLAVLTYLRAWSGS